MNTLALTIKQGSYVGAIFKWLCLSVFLMISGISIYTIHQQKLQNLTSNSNVLVQQSFLVSQMHDEMLAISRTQLQILHASNEQQIRKELYKLSELISDHLMHYHQLQLISDESDADLLDQFKVGIEKWYYYNENLLDYANSVSDTGFLKTLSMINLAFSQIDSNPDDAIQIVAQLKQNIKQLNELSN